MVIERSRDMEKELFNYLEYLKRKGFKDSTVRDHSLTIQRFSWFLKENYPEAKEAIEVTRNMILDYEKYLMASNDSRRKPRSAVRRKRYLSCLKNFFLYLEREERIYRNPAVNIAFPKDRKKLLKNVLTIEEMDKLLKLCSGHSLKSLRDRAIMEILYSTGIRADELCNIEVQDIDFAEKLLFVRKGKMDNQRIIPFGESAKYWITRYMEKGRPLINPPKETAKGFDPGRLLFLSLYGTKLNPPNLCRIVKNWKKRAGIEKNVTTHTFRHTCASHILKGGADIRYVQQQLGHKDIASTEKYLKIEITDLKAVHERCHPREQESW